MQKIEVASAMVAFEQDVLQNKAQECRAVQGASSSSPSLSHLRFTQRKVSINHKIVLRTWWV